MAVVRDPFVVEEVSDNQRSQNSINGEKAWYPLVRMGFGGIRAFVSRRRLLNTSRAAVRRSFDRCHAVRKCCLELLVGCAA